MLYHLSIDPYLTMLTPRVSTKINEMAIEDREVKRISMASTIDGCLRALYPTCVKYHMGMTKSFFASKKRDSFEKQYNEQITEKMKLLAMTYEDMEAANIAELSKEHSRHLPYPVYYVYVPVSDGLYDKIHFIEPSQVYDQKETGEIWLLKPTKVMKIGCIYVRYGEPLYMTRYEYTKSGKKKKYDSTVYTYNYVTAPTFYVSHSRELLTKRLKKDGALK